MCPIEKYISTIRKITDAISRFLSFGVSLSMSASLALSILSKLPAAALF